MQMENMMVAKKVKTIEENLIESLSKTLPDKIIEVMQDTDYLDDAVIESLEEVIREAIGNPLIKDAIELKLLKAIDKLTISEDNISSAIIKKLLR